MHSISVEHRVDKKVDTLPYNRLAVAIIKLQMQISRVHLQKCRHTTQDFTHHNDHRIGFYPRWTKILLIIYFVIILHLISILAHLYLHDFNLQQLKRYPVRYNDYTNYTNSNDIESRAFEQINWSKFNELRNSIQLYKYRLNLLGLPQLDVQFVFQILIACNLVNSLIVYPLGQILFNYISAYDSSLLCLLFSSDRENQYVDRLTRQLVKFNLSNGNSMNPDNVQTHTYKSTSPKNVQFNISIKESSAFDCSYNMQTILEDKNLVPLQLRNSWKQQQLKMLNWMLMFNVSCAINIDGFFIFAALILINYDTFHISIMNLLLLIEWIALIVIENFTTSFHVLNQTFHCVDQTMLSQRLRQDIADCIATNKKLLFDHRKKSSVLPSIRLRVNTNLFIILVHYQVLLIQAKRYASSLYCVTIAAAILLFHAPLIARLNSPFLDPKLDKTIRSAVTLISLGIVIPMDMCIIPQCMMYASYLKLYRALYAILAHMAEANINDDDNDDNPVVVYNSRLVELFKSELDRPKGLRNQFDANSTLAYLDYPRLIRVHFYLGFLVIRIIFEAQITKQVSPGFSSSDMFSKIFDIF